MVVRVCAPSQPRGPAECESASPHLRPQCESASPSLPALRTTRAASQHDGPHTSNHSLASRTTSSRNAGQSHRQLSCSWLLWLRPRLLSIPAVSVGPLGGGHSIAPLWAVELEERRVARTHAQMRRRAEGAAGCAVHRLLTAHAPPLGSLLSAPSPACQLSHTNLHHVHSSVLSSG